MVKIVLSLFLIISIGFGDLIDDKIKSFIGEKSFYSSKKIIKILLGDKKRYYKADGKVDIIKLLRVLKKNGFMKLELEHISSINITFITKNKPLLFLKILNSALNSMGFNFYITKKAIRTEDSFSWTIRMNTEYLIDPVLLAKELKKYGCLITDIQKSGKTKWQYFLSMQNAKLVVKNIVPEVSYKLRKPINSYWLGFDEVPHTIYIKSYPLNRWHPYIVFYDSALNAIFIYKSDKIVKQIKLDIPQSTKYVLIDDAYTLSNIRSGLKIYSK